jgi:hypothetical protein
MSGDLERQLRASLRRFPAQVSPGLARKAYVRYRRRRLAARAVAATGTAAVAGIAIAVGIAGTSSPQVETAAYVVSHATKALGAAPVQDPVVLVRATDGSLEEWFRDLRYRQEAFTRQGHLRADYGSIGTSTEVTTVSVDYAAKTWRRYVNTNEHAFLSAPPSPCGPGDPYIGITTTPAEMATQLRQSLSCGVLKVGGAEHIDGVDTIKLVIGKRYSWVTTLWVDHVTYQPVRMRVPVLGTAAVVDYDVEWLPPTAGNLASLTVPIPAGFTRVPGQPTPPSTNAP